MNTTTVMHCNSKAVQRGASCFGLFVDKFILHKRRTAISQLLIKIVTVPLDSVTTIS